MHNLTIYLLLPKYKDARDAIVQGSKHFEISDAKGHIGELFVKPGPPKPPKWAAFFSGFVDAKSLGSTQNTSALLVVAAKGRQFAIAFGQGRFLLDPESYEERFGLLVTLNSVPAGSLRSIDKHTFDAADQNSRVQANKLSTAFEFGIDVQRDLVRGIVGYPKDVGLGRRLAGADALTVTTEVPIPKLKRLLGRLLDKFESSDYQDQFAWIDHIHRLRPKGLKATELDQQLIAKLEASRSTNGVIDGCWLSIPEVIEWSRVDGFKFSMKTTDGVDSDLHLPGFIRTLKKDDVLSIAFLKRRPAFAVNGEESVEYKWSVYKCLHCEISDSDGSYILSAGNWFEIEKSFVDDMASFFEHFPRYGEPLMEYNHASESEYNSKLSELSDGRLVLMDAKPIMVGGIYDKVEFCDVYSNQHELLHIKRYGNSNVLGHLFNQGLVSGELLRQHGPYPKLVNEKLPDSHHLDPDDTVPRNVDGFTIVFGIISQSTKPLHLPFFAIVSLRNVYTRLTNIGFKSIYMAKIDSNPAVKVIRVAAPKKRKPRTARKRKP